MLLFLKLISEKYDANKKQVDRTSHRLIATDSSPCLFHIPAPMDIIKNKYCIIMDIWQNLLKISFSRFLAMIAINKTKIKRLYLFKD